MQKGKMCEAYEIEDTLESILLRGNAPRGTIECEAGNIAALTAWNRSKWATARARLLADKSNLDTLRTIETAAFIVVLEAAAPGKDVDMQVSRAFFCFEKKLWTVRITSCFKTR